MRDNQARPGEVAVTAPAPNDAGLIFIGRIHTPWTTRSKCPRQGDPDGPVCCIEIFPPWQMALQNIDDYPMLDVLYWLHAARRDLVVQCRTDSTPRGTFSLRSPNRPNPIGVSTVALVAVRADGLDVRGLDCIDGTPLIDLKPARKAG